MAAKTKLLMHFDNNLLDSSNSGHSPSATIPLYESEVKKFGTHCYNTNISDNTITVPYSTDFEFTQSTNFTLELWATGFVYSGGEFCLIKLYDDDDNYWKLLMEYTSGFRYEDLTFFHRVAGSTEIEAFASSVNFGSTDEFFHILVVRVGNDFGIYVNGIQVAYDSGSISTVGSGATLIIAEYSFTSAMYHNYIDELRIVHGNPYNLAPVVGLTDSFNKQKIPYGPFSHKLNGISMYKVDNIGGIVNTNIHKINGVE